MKTITKLWILIGILAIVSPAGLIVPELTRSDGAWGEWSAGHVGTLVGYVPKGLARLSSLWSAPLPDYAFRAGEGMPLKDLSIAYIVSAIAGIAVTAVVIFAVGRVLADKGKREE